MCEEKRNCGSTTTQPRPPRSCALVAQLPHPPRPWTIWSPSLSPSSIKIRMNSTQSTINQRPAHPQSSAPHHRESKKITVTYHTAQDYARLLGPRPDPTFPHSADSYKGPLPSRHSPPAPPIHTVLNNPRSPTETTASAFPRVRNSLQKSPPRAHKHSYPPSTSPTSPRPAESDPFAANGSTPLSLTVVPNPNGMASPLSPPPRPSRANTATLHDLYPSQAAIAARRLSTPPPSSTDTQFYADPNESVPPLTPIDFTLNSPAGLPPVGTRSRSGTTSAKSKKGVLGFMSELLNTPKRLEISPPYDPVHLTHVGFNSSTGEFTGLPKEWQQLLQESGISRSDQEKNPQAVMEIVKFYQEGHGDVWAKMGAVPDPSPSPMLDDGFQNPVSKTLSALSGEFKKIYNNIK